MTIRTIAQISRCVAVLALVGACATKPQVSASVEAGQYRSHAGRSYTPPGPASDPWGPYINEAAAKYDVPQRWIREVMRQESGGRMYGRGGDLITSGAGAMGLMQVMPATYDELRARYRELGDDPFDPHNNIMAGTAYIREMYDIYGSPGFLAAYNAGPGRLDDYLTRNRVLPLETRRYVASIGPRISGAEPRTPSPGAQYALNALPFNIPDGPRYSAGSRYSAPSDPMPAEAPAAPQIMPQAQPIEVAEAVPAVRYAPLPAPIQTASAAQPRAPYIVLNPPLPAAPMQVAEAPEPRYSNEPRYSGESSQPARPQSRLAPIQTALAPAPLPTPPSPRLAQFAQSAQPMPEPPRYVAPPQATSQASQGRTGQDQRMLASAALVPLSPPRGGFSLVSPASAEPIARHAASGGAGWAVQVGAYANEGLASSANASARGHARDVLGPARSSITTVRQPHGTLYRARLTGLTHDAAAQACERLAHVRATCILVSPDAQL